MRKGVNLIIKGFNQLRKDDAIVALCEEKATNALKALGDGYEVSRRDYVDRTGFSVRTATPDAMRDNLKNNSLAKAILGG